MSNPNIKSNLLVELSSDEQQLLAGGCCHYQPCCKPKKRSCEYQKDDRYPRYDNDHMYGQNGNRD
ncbi:MAG: hypothetical protein ACK4V0_00140 [Aphanizomenon sp.]|jgi:hypothetical protein